MTSAQILTSGGLRLTAPILALAGLAVLESCNIFPPPSPLKQPVVLASPAPQPRLWAVAPFANESGVSSVDTSRVADGFREELEQVRGIDTIAVNRVLGAMQALNLRAVGSPNDAMQLVELLGVDAIVVGTVTTWDPYPPPSLGMAVQVFERAGRRQTTLDPRDLVRSTTGGDAALGEVGPGGATAQATGVYDSRNNQVLAWLEAYAKGRTEPDEAFGSEVYLMNMDLYTKFVSYRLIHDLLAFERSRMSPPTQAQR